MLAPVSVGQDDLLQEAASRLSPLLVRVTFTTAGDNVPKISGELFRSAKCLLAQTETLRYASQTQYLYSKYLPAIIAFPHVLTDTPGVGAGRGP